MDYEKKYKEAFERAKKYKLKEDLIITQDIFPELAEPEDERTWIINYLSNRKANSSILEEKKNLKKAIAWLEKQESVGEIVPRCKISWYNEGKIQGQIEGLSDDKKYQQGWHDALEKQGEQKPNPCDGCINRKGCINCENGELRETEHKPADNVEPKFKQGNWVVNKRHSYLIAYIDYEQRRYLFEISGYTHEQLNWEYIENADKKYHLWTIQDAKEGDVLCTYECEEPKIVFILKGTPKKHYALSYYCYYNIMYPHFDDGNKPGCLAPEDSDVKPATKEQRDQLEKAMVNAGYAFNFEKKELEKIEQNPAWSEEDEQYLLVCKNALAKYQKTDKWDASIIFHWLENKLKSLRPQSQWKPSESDILLLERISNGKSDPRDFQASLQSIIEQLKKLREE